MTAPWYVCRAPADFGRLVRALDECRRNGVEVYAPLTWLPIRVRVVGGRRMITEKPIPAYPGWAFSPVPIVLAGIRSLVWEATGAPVTISAKEKERIEGCELRWRREHEAAVAKHRAPIEPGMRVVITDGWTAGRTGVVEKVTAGHYRVRLDVPMIGADAMVVRREWVKLVTEEAIAA